MVERLLILLVISGLLGVGYWVWKQLLVQRIARLAESKLPAELSAFLSTPGPTVLYFTAEWCAQCRMRQAPILEQLVSATAIPIQKIDAVEHEQLAAHFGVMTLPTTVLLDSQRRPIAVNHGLAPLHQLREQVLAMS